MLFAVRRVPFSLLFCTCTILLFLILVLSKSSCCSTATTTAHISVSLGGLKTYRNRFYFNIQENRHVLCAFLPLLLLAGDVHPNPGPRHPKFPCSSCTKAVKKNDPAICCDRCDRWIHSRCCGMSATTYSTLQNSSFTWLCPSCGLPSFTNSYFESSQDETANLFSFINRTTEVENQNVSASPNTHCVSNAKTSRTTKIKAMSLNINGLRSKNITLLAEIETRKLDLVFLQETKIDSDMFSSEFFSNDFDIFRKDRNKFGGGVLIAIRKNLKAISCEFLTCDLEMIWIKILSTSNEPIYLGCCYRPPGPDGDFSVKLQDCLSKIFSKHPNIPPKIILVGDFNFPNILWNEISVFPSPISGGNFIETLDCFSLEQEIHESTRYSQNTANTLDLLISNYSDNLSDIKVCEPLSDHCMITFNISGNKQNGNLNRRKICLYNKANFNLIRQNIENFGNTFNEVKTRQTVEENWCMFRDFIHKLVNDCIPVKYVKSFKKSWLTRSQKSLINKRNRLAGISKTSGTVEDDNKFRKFRNYVNSKLKNGHRNYVNKIIEDIPNNPKKFYRYVKSKKVESSDIPLLSDGTKSISDDKPKSNLLNTYFASVFNRNKYNVNNLNLSRNCQTVSDIKISENGILNLLSKINVKKSIGPDEIPSRILLEAKQEICPILTYIFNQSLLTSALPKDWLSANVHPLHKKGPKDLPENYRPISLTCICCKMLEHIVHSHISNHLLKLNLLDPNQHGFLKNRSCTTQLISAFNDWSSFIDKKMPAILAVFDFSKAFDSVPHDLLIAKLPLYGISGLVLDWISAFLHTRRQRVTLNGSTSNWLPVDSGVPQGSVLGPLLFLLYINDISNNVNSTVRLFADDLIMYRTLNNSTSKTGFQDDIDKLLKWANKWGMNFNAKKCHVVNISNLKTTNSFKYRLGNCELQYLDIFTYLGVLIGSDLNLSHHVNTTYNKASRTLNFVKRNVAICNSKYRALAYTSLVRPHLEYACAAWDPHYLTYTSKLEKVQNNAARFVFNNYRRETSVSALKSELNWPLLETRRKIARLTEFYKIVNGTSPIPNACLATASANTRAAANYQYRNLYSRTNTYKFSFFPRSIRDWNELPLEFRLADSVDVFKSSVTRFFNTSSSCHSSSSHLSSHW